MSNYKIHIETILRAPGLTKRLLKRATELVLSAEQIAQAEVTIILVDDEYIRKLNNDFLDHDTPTDVISFLLSDDHSNDFVEGEVYANLDQIARQAMEYGVTFENELFRIIIHGVLHLIGYDDQTRHEKETMTSKENYYLSILPEQTNQGG